MTNLTQSKDEQALVNLANQVLPAGGFGNLSSNVVIREGKGGRVWDVSGNEYVDYLLGSGPMLIGHGQMLLMDQCEFLFLMIMVVCQAT